MAIKGIVMRIFNVRNSLSTAALVSMIIATCMFPALESAAAETFHLTLGYTGTAYQETTNQDIKVAVRLLIQKVALKYFGKSEATYYDSIPEMAAALNSGKVQVLCGPPEEFMDLRNRAPVDPILITSSSNGPQTELLLLVRKDSGIQTLSDLKNKSIVLPLRYGKANMFRVWIETLLMRAGHANLEAYFSVVKETRTATRGIMPVFFHQADACVVTRQLFNLAAELNPQLARELVPIARIPNLSQGIISVDRRLPVEIRDKIKQAFMTLPDSPEGKQLLMLFQVKKIVPFRPEYLAATEALFAEHQRLKTRFARR